MSAAAERLIELYNRGFNDGYTKRPLIFTSLPEYEQSPYGLGVLDGRKMLATGTVSYPLLQEAA